MCIRDRRQTLILSCLRSMAIFAFLLMDVLIFCLLFFSNSVIDAFGFYQRVEIFHKSLLTVRKSVVSCSRRFYGLPAVEKMCIRDSDYILKTHLYKKVHRFLTKFLIKKALSACLTGR